MINLKYHENKRTNEGLVAMCGVLSVAVDGTFDAFRTDVFEELAGGIHQGAVGAGCKQAALQLADGGGRATRGLPKGLPPEGGGRNGTRSVEFR